MATEEGPEAVRIPAEEVPAVVAAATFNIKLPPFWPADPEVWFAQVEAHFATKRLNAQKARFDYVVASLTPEIATEIRDLILKPPTVNPYNVLKTALIKRTAASEQRRLQQLFQTEEMGDRKPTQLLRRMQQLLGDRAGIDGTFMRELFLQKLPTNIRMVLASSSATTSLEELAELADKIAEVAAPGVAAIQQTPITEELAHLKTEMAKLQIAITSLSRRRSHTPSRHRSNSPTPNTHSSPSEEGLCWYHRKFGSEARKCTPPCSHSPNELASH